MLVETLDPVKVPYGRSWIWRPAEVWTRATYGPNRGGRCRVETCEKDVLEFPTAWKT